MNTDHRHEDTRSDADRWRASPAQLYGKRELAFEPGARWDYSNYGFLLLGVVIQRATGKSYYDWVNDHVFARAGMAATASLPEDQVVPDLLDAKHTDLLTTAKTETPGGGKYGYGFGEDSSDGVRCIGHGGGAPGMNGDLQICDSGYTIAVLSNLDPPAATRISAFIRNRLPAKAP